MIGEYETQKHTRPTHCSAQSACSHSLPVAVLAAQQGALQLKYVMWRYAVAPWTITHTVMWWHHRQQHSSPFPSSLLQAQAQPA
jgi:hypothetical protein